ncbi:MAG: DUF1385 domain-containing protein [Chloroflexi bacterium]|nr:DUF1385 domain-containing protein [Chloroflexota bacterium]
MQGRFTYGGQAVIEGVMMRGMRHIAIAVRGPDGGIVSKVEELGKIASTPLRKWPFVRGVLVLAEAMSVGMRALQFSAAVSLGREDPKMTRSETFVMMGFAISITVAVFFVGPVAAVGAISRWVDNPLLAGTIEGALRLGLFLGYLLLISTMPDIKRVFMYHGAEHMTIHAFEHGAPLTIDGIRPFPTAHPRCGTSFLITVMLIATVTFALVGNGDWWWRLSSRVILVPIIAGAAYEVIRLAAFNEGSVFGRALAWPGLALQGITTKRPDDSQIEVALDRGKRSGCGVDGWRPFSCSRKLVALWGGGRGPHPAACGRLSLPQLWERAVGTWTRTHTAPAGRPLTTFAIQASAPRSSPVGPPPGLGEGQPFRRKGRVRATSPHRARSSDANQGRDELPRPQCGKEASPWRRCLVCCWRLRSWARWRCWPRRAASWRRCAASRRRPV